MLMSPSCPLGAALGEWKGRLSLPHTGHRAEAGAGGLCALALFVQALGSSILPCAPLVSGRILKDPPAPCLHLGVAGPVPPLLSASVAGLCRSQSPLVSSFSMTAQGSWFLPAASVNCLPETVGPSSQTTTQFRLRLTDRAFFSPAKFTCILTELPIQQRLCPHAPTPPPCQQMNGLPDGHAHRSRRPGIAYTRGSQPHVIHVSTRDNIRPQDLSPRVCSSSPCTQGCVLSAQYHLTAPIYPLTATLLIPMPWACHQYPWTRSGAAPGR